MTRAATPTPARRTLPPLPKASVETWNRLLEELRLCLRDDGRRREALHDLLEAARARDTVWPGHGDRDSFLLAGFLRLAHAWRCGTAAERGGWLGVLVAQLLEKVEAMVDDQTAPDDVWIIGARAAAGAYEHRGSRFDPWTPPPKTAPPATPRAAPAPGERGYRADIDG